MTATALTADAALCDTLTLPPLDAEPAPLMRFEAPPADGFALRIARDVADAETIRRLVREAWRLRPGDRYFYDLFERPLAVFERFIAPVVDGAPVGEIEALCLLIEHDGEALGTISLIYDHAARTVEMGRGAIRPSSQSLGLSRRAVAGVRRFLEATPGYAVVADATVVQPGAGRFAVACGAMPVGLYPSTFVFQRQCVDPWLAALRGTRGEALTDALVHRSARTGLGRFMTAFHLDLPEGGAAFAPVTTPRQALLAAWTHDVLGLTPGEQAQPATHAPQRVDDNRLTATRTISAPAADLDVEDALLEARAAGIETLCIRVPCDAAHRPLAGRLEWAGALLGGVHPDAHGRWSAGYVLPIGEVHRAAVIRGMTALADLAELGRPGDYADLLDRVLEANALNA